MTFHHFHFSFQMKRCNGLKEARLNLQSKQQATSLSLTLRRFPIKCLTLGRNTHILTTYKLSPCNQVESLIIHTLYLNHPFLFLLEIFSTIRSTQTCITLSTLMDFMLTQTKTFVSTKSLSSVMAKANQNHHFSVIMVSYLLRQKIDTLLALQLVSTVPTKMSYKQKNKEFFRSLMTLSLD